MKIIQSQTRTTATALAGGARGADPAQAKASRFALRARELAAKGRIPPVHATKLYGVKK